MRLKPTTANYTRLLTTTIVGVLAALLLIDSYGNSATSEKLIGINSEDLILWVLLICASLRIVFSQRIPSRITQLFGLAAALLAPVIAIFSALTYLSGDNVLYATTRIQIVELSLLTMFLAGIALINQSTDWWQRNFDRIIVLLPFAAFLFFALARLWPLNYFLEIVKEDNVVENAQAIILFVGSGAAAWLALWFKHHRRLWLFGTYLVVALGFFVAGAEEISWGQRILGIETPADFAERNLQGEITIHNLPEIQRYMHAAYLTLTLFGFLGRPMIRTLRPFTQWAERAKLHTYLPDSRFMFYFLPPFFFFFGNIIISWGVWHEWSEVMELFIYTGVVAWILWLGVEKVRTTQPSFLKKLLPKQTEEW